MTEYTLADLTRITGAKRRSVQLWAEAGVIHAAPLTERAGTGTHRRFSRDEAIVACIVHAFARRQIAIGELISIGDAARWFLSRPKARSAIESAIEDKSYELLFLTTWEIQGSYSASLIEAPRELNKVLEIPWLIPGDGPLDNLTNHHAFAGVILLNTWLAGLR